MANSVSNVGFTSPNDYATETADIARKRKLAEALQLEAQQPGGGTQMVGGWAIPNSPWQGVGKIAQALSGNYQQKQLTQQQKDLNTRTDQEAQDWIKGMPADQSATNIQYADASGNMQPMDLPAQKVTPQDRLAWALKGAQMANPMASQLGSNMVSQEMTRRQIADALAQVGGGGGASPAGGAPASGGGIPGVSPIAMALQSSGVAPLGKIGEWAQNAFVEQNKPWTNRGFGGGLWINGKYVPDEATTGQAAQTAGAVESSKSGAAMLYSMQQMKVPVYLPGGDQIEVNMNATQAHQYQQTGQLPPEIAASIPGLAKNTPPQAPQQPQGAPPQQGQPAPTQPAGVVQPPVPGGYAGLQQSQPARNIQAANIQQQEAQPNGGNLLPANQVVPTAPPPSSPIGARPVIGRGQSQNEGIDQAAEKERKVKFANEQAQLQAGAPVARAHIADATTGLQRMEDLAAQISRSPALNRITGAMGILPNMPGSKASDVEANLNSLKSQVGFAVLQSMRDASKTGGALGAISDKENALLQTNLAALEKSQSPEAIRENLGKLITYAQQARGRLQRGYSDQYERVVGNQGMQPTQQGAQPTTQVIPPQGSSAQSLFSQADAILNGNR